MVYASAVTLEGWYSSDHIRQRMVQINMYVFWYAHLRNLTNWITENGMWEQQSDDLRKLTVWNKAIYLVPGSCSDHRGTRHMSFLSPVSFWKASCHKFCHFLVEKLHYEILSTGSEEFLVHFQGPAFCSLLPTTCSQCRSMRREVKIIQFCTVPIHLEPNEEFFHMEWCFKYKNLIFLVI